MEYIHAWWSRDHEPDSVDTLNYHASSETAQRSEIVLQSFHWEHLDDLPGGLGLHRDHLSESHPLARLGCLLVLQDNATDARQDHLAVVLDGVRYDRFHRIDDRLHVLLRNSTGSLQRGEGVALGHHLARPTLHALHRCAHGLDHLGIWWLRTKDLDITLSQGQCQNKP